MCLYTYVVQNSLYPDSSLMSQHRLVKALLERRCLTMQIVFINKHSFTNRCPIIDILLLLMSAFGHDGHRSSLLRRTNTNCGSFELTNFPLTAVPAPLKRTMQ